MFDLARTFIQAVERNPAQIALVSGDRRVSYESWSKEIGALQRYFSDLGLKRGNRVLTLLQNRHEAATIHWACQSSGITVVPVNWRSKPEEIDFFVDNADASLVIVEDVSALHMAQAVCSKSVRVMLCGSSSAQMSAIDHYDQIVASGFEPELKASADDWSVMLYTSGTTGKPKGVPRRQRAERAAAIAHVAQNQYQMHEVTIGVMPLYHTMGVRTLLSMCLVNGTFVAFPRWNPELFISTIENERASHLYLVPTLYHDMLNSSDFDPIRVRSVRKLGFAGAPMHDALLLKLQDAFQPQLFVNHYGSSEIYTYSINQRAVQTPGSAGMPGFNARLKVVRFDEGERWSTSDDVCPRGVEGQIICDLSSDEAFEGYWKRPEVDHRSLRHGWFFTGDTGYLDANGELYVTGRVDDMIISGGENISPIEIESVLSMHASVSEVAVCGLHDERLGQRVVAFITTRGPVTSDELDTHCRTSDLMNFKRPREYIFIKQIPKSPVGKVLRRELIQGNFERLM
jgi:2-furoate---CoA ligase